MRPHGDITDDGSDAFTDFMSQCAHRLYRVAYLLTGGRGQAEELTQSALVRAYTAWHRIRHDEAYGYARRILVNLHNDWWRGRLRWERPAAHPPDQSAGGDPATVVTQRQQVAAALQGLTRRERTVIVCRYFLDLSEQQTADELNLAVGTVKSATARGLAKLRIAPDLDPDVAVGRPTYGRSGVTRTVADLRRAMIEETENLAPRVTVADVRQQARHRRRLRWAVTALVAALVPLLAGQLINGLQPAAPPSPAPTPRPAPTVPISIHPSFPPVGDVITTGVRVGNDNDLVFWFYEGPGFSAGLRNTATGTVRSLDGGGGGDHGFANLAQIDDRRGGLVDYGLFVGDAARITMSIGGQQVDAELAPWSNDPSFIVFWARHTGTPLPPTGAPATTGVAQPRFTAYDRAGKVIATSQARSQRSDGGVNAEDRPRVGDMIRTGTPTASGRELVLWFVGDDKGALLKAGEWDPRSGTATELKVLGGFARPPFAIGFYGGYDQIEGPGGTQIVLGTYVGRATRVVMAHPAEGVTTGSARWSAQPELVIFWAVNVPTATAHEISAVAFDANGRVLAATNFRN